MRLLRLLAATTSLLLSAPIFAADEIPMEARFDGMKYSDIVEDKVPVNKVVISSLNVKVGVHLERLTLISGEGHTDDKISAGLLAGAATLLGGRGGTDWASREPIGDHLPEADAQKIGDEIATMVTEAIRQSGFALVNPEEVVSLPDYARIKGETKNTTGSENVKGNLFNASYFFGYRRLTELGYKYRERGMFDMASDDFSRPAREATGAPLALAWNINIVNDRKVMRVRELSLIGIGKMGNRDSALMTITVKPDAVNVSSGESHRNLDYWTELSPKFNLAVQEVMAHVAEAVRREK